MSDIKARDATEEKKDRIPDILAPAMMPVTPLKSTPKTVENVTIMLFDV